ncbi:hypothetical protein [Pleurochrysis sp. endemic virus 1b]|nr:hypothetical protein [Pleurochrysis sp. endemic virus 1b]
MRGNASFFTERENWPKTCYVQADHDMICLYITGFGLIPALSEDLDGLVHLSEQLSRTGQLFRQVDTDVQNFTERENWPKTCYVQADHDMICLYITGFGLIPALSKDLDVGVHLSEQLSRSGQLFRQVDDDVQIYSQSENETKTCYTHLNHSMVEVCVTGFGLKR